MTTVAFKDGIMACDSRVTGGPLTTIKCKVVTGQNAVVGYCGDAIAGYTGALYLSGQEQDRPETHRDDAVWFLIWDGKRLSVGDSEYRTIPIESKFYAIGSGEMAAMVAMDMGATAKEAVRMAIKYDEGSGGRIHEFSF